MTVYFDLRVQNPETASINTIAIWHSNFPLLAVASYSHNKGGFVRIYDDHGEPCQDAEPSEYRVSQVTALQWHPEKKILVAGWENGEMKSWCDDIKKKKFSEISSLHKSQISILQWSQRGGRLVSADIVGVITGWTVDSQGQLRIVFCHNLKESITHIAFKMFSTKVSHHGFDPTSVSREENSNLVYPLSSWRPRTAIQTASQTQKDTLSFFTGSSGGSIHYINSTGQFTKVLDTESKAIYGLMYHQVKDCLILMTEDLTISQFQVDITTGKLSELIKIKINAKNTSTKTESSICWIGINTLAILTGETSIRCWNLQTGDTYVLSIPESQNKNAEFSSEICTSISFCKYSNTLAAGTDLGTIYFWKKKSTLDTDENGWSLDRKNCVVHGTVRQLTWSGLYFKNSLLAVNCITNVFILYEQAMSIAYHEDTIAKQISATQLLLETNQQTCTVNTDIQIRILGVSNDYVAVSSGKQITIYRINKSTSLHTTIEQFFNCDVEKILIYESTLIILTSTHIQLRTIEGSVIQILPTLPEEGEPIVMELTNHFLTVASLNGILKIWDLKKREAKLHTRAMAIYDVISDFSEVIEAKCNINCRCVSLTVATSNLLPSPILYIWDVEGDQMFEFDFSKFHEHSDNSNKTIVESHKKLITEHFWDTLDSRVLICNIQTIKNTNINHHLPVSSTTDDKNNTSLVCIFATPEHGITIHDVRSLNNAQFHLLGVKSPHMILLNLTDENTENQLTYLLMREFEELNDYDDAVRKAVMDFSFHISMANTEEAFKSIQAIKNEKIWKSLAKMCIKTKHLNMAILCLGHMKYVRGSKALRATLEKSDLSLEAKIGILAVELELYDDAERLFFEAKRFDLLSKLYQARNKFSDAINLTKEKNKICEKLVYYQYAKSLEQDGDIEQAIDMYTKAESHKFEVPRILLNQPAKLQKYLEDTNDLEIRNWYAQYIESTGDLESALRLYETAKDTLSVIRLLCYLGRENEACDLVMKNNHAASAYHLAAHYESMNNLPQAVHFYRIAKAYTNAIRICKEHDMIEELWPLVMLAPRQTQIDIAKYYEDVGNPDKAVLLYHKAGLLAKAFELSFETQQYDILQSIILDVKDDSDPSLIKKCADFFLENNQIVKAIELLAIGKQYNQVLKLIEEHDIILTSDLAEKMTIPKDDNNSIQEQYRISILEKIGEIAFTQGNYHLASKKFTQAGNKLKAMKALLKSGDTEKICFFAQVSRNRDIYIMAGNYLQSLDWQNQPEILKNIINFYSKGKAMDLLANFYTTCAQVEIDEFQNYEKALDALNQAAKCLSKLTSPRDSLAQKKAVELINTRISIIKRLLEIKKLFIDGEGERAISQGEELIATYKDTLNQCIRLGDLFSLITRHYMKVGDLQKARASIEELKYLVPGVDLNCFYSNDLLKSLGHQTNISNQKHENKDYEIEELLDE
ncbi:intraflagellar transport protein 140 homolog [Chelonus insularis]|uniref:intraflagellar transport protein 140 homolog n=1 Tax=Chelonus insularis TaxID=460826 RepID=UPI00158F12B9|nr:intraflagellar transport protein 140 homolog [Chelonus insularis]